MTKKLVTLQVRVPLHLLNKIEKKAYNHQTTISKQLRLMIENS
jgi:hypothetical protein